MAEGCIYIYTGDGRGKSPAAIGRAVQAAVEGKRVVIIQFLKGKGLEDSDSCAGWNRRSNCSVSKIGQQFCRIA